MIVTVPIDLIDRGLITSVALTAPPSVGWEDVTLLLHFEDGNGSTSFHDDSNSNFTVIGQDGGIVTPSQYKFGIGSLNIPGTTGSQRAEIAQAINTGFDFGSGDFTIECFARFVSGNGTPAWHILDAWQTGTQRFLLRYSSSTDIEFFAYPLFSASANKALSSPYTWVSGTWVHLAVTRQGVNWRLFIDGTLVALNGVAQSNETGAIATGTTALYIGNSTSNDGWGGQIDCVRFTKGYALYTTAFTPSTVPFERKSIIPALVFNPDQNTGFSLGNNNHQAGSGGANVTVVTTRPPEGIKRYAEFSFSSLSSSTSAYFGVKIGPTSSFTTYAVWRADGISYTSGVASTNLSASFSISDIGQIAYDPITGNTWIGKNNVWCNSGNPEIGTSPITNFGANTEVYFVFQRDNNAAGNIIMDLPNGASFTYVPPAGFYAW